MTKNMKSIVDTLVVRYEQLIKQAEVKGISVWDKKAELVQLKKDIAIHRATEVVVPVVKDVKKPKPLVEVTVTPEPVEYAHEWSPDDPKPMWPGDSHNDEP